MDKTSGQFTLVDNSSTGTLSGMGAGDTTVGRTDVDVDYSDSLTLVEAGDVFAVLIQLVGGRCVAKPYPLSSMKGTAVPTIFRNQYSPVDLSLSSISPIVNLHEFNLGMFSFDARIQLTGI